MENNIKFKHSLPALFLIFFYGCGASFQLSSDTGLTQPEWASGYDNQGIHYYYFPDYGIYYNVPDHEYVYVDEGNWVYSSVLPPMYSSIDFYNSYMVGLDYRVHDPWRHHSLYASHYPPYYYRNRDVNPDRNVRGFNENTRSTFSRRSTNDHNEARPSGTVRSGNVSPANPVNNNRRTQPIQYNNNRKVGQPVRVSRDMRPQSNNTTNSQRRSVPNQNGSDNDRRR